MRIVPYPDFRHAGSLRGYVKDPRQQAFEEPRIDVDLRDCQFIRPAAVLWCVVYPLLARSRGSHCRLLVPTDIGVCIYLKSIGLFRILQEAGIEADDRDIPERDAGQLVLSLTRFNTESQVEELTNQALEALRESRLGAANLYPVVSDVFAELALNAVQHAESPVDSYGLIQFYESMKGRRFVCTVADGGIGIRKSLEKNPQWADQVPYDWVAIELATKERVSGINDQVRGIGLVEVLEQMRKPGRQLIIHSGQGSLQINEDMQSGARRVQPFPGTVAYASIPT